jgi:hypothetical protein
VAPVACAVEDFNKALVVPPVELPAEEAAAGRFTLLTFVPHSSLTHSEEVLANRRA